MDIQEFKKEKLRLEKKILHATREAVFDFKKKTGYYPHNISVYMADVTAIGHRKEHIVTNVEVDINLFS